MGVGGQRHAPAPRYPLHKRLGGPQVQSGRVQKFFPSPGFDPRFVKPVVSRYTDYAIRAHKTEVAGKIKTHISYSITFFRKSCRLSDNVGKYCGTGQATDDNIITAHALCMLDI